MRPGSSKSVASRLFAVMIAAAAAAPFLAIGSAAGSAGPVNTVDPSKVAGDVGDVVLIGLDGDPINDGDASTRFFVRLPEGAACPGDSVNDQWRVNTFLIPAAQDPLDVLFGSSGPEPPWTSGMYPLFENGNNLPLVFTMLRRNATAGRPGLIETVPETGFTVVADNQFPGGDYRLGIACSYFAQTTQFWDTELTMSAAPDVTWAISGTTPPPSTDSESSSQSWIWVLVSGAVAVLGLLIWRRRRASILSTANNKKNTMKTATTKTPTIKTMTKDLP